MKPLTLVQGSGCSPVRRIGRKRQFSLCIAGITGFLERLDSAGAPSMILQETPAEQAYNQPHDENPCQVSPCGARYGLWPASIVVDPSEESVASKNSKTLEKRQ